MHSDMKNWNTRLLNKELNKEVLFSLLMSNLYKLIFNLITVKNCTALRLKIENYIRYQRYSYSVGR